ncbi:MAG: hypothetical protein OEU54_03740 [Gemmatimonadota bacterium]|nr:hypothetical protein [Gemmatimonadota bacterium]
MTEPTNDTEAIQAAIRRLNERAWGISTGLVLGLGLLVATLFLVIKGGANVGQHLNLLGNYLPGYRVTFLGAFIGFVYAFVLGYGAGRVVGTVYNRMVR